MIAFLTAFFLYGYFRVEAEQDYQMESGDMSATVEAHEGNYLTTIKSLHTYIDRLEEELDACHQEKLEF